VVLSGVISEGGDRDGLVILVGEELGSFICQVELGEVDLGSRRQEDGCGMKMGDRPRNKEKVKRLVSFLRKRGVLPSWRKALRGKWHWRLERAGMVVMLVRGVGAALGAQKRGTQRWIVRRRCIVCYATRMNT